MSVVCQSKISGEYHGWDGNTIYQLTNGQIWQQARYHYHYHYAYRPDVTIVRESSRHIMIVRGDNDKAYVRRIG